MSKTPWKKIVSDPNFLGEADFDAGEEKVATIARVASNVTVQTADGKQSKSVVYFAEPIKPMILNVARAKSIAKVTGSRFIEDWSGHKIQLYVDEHVKAFGDIVAAVRVRPTKPKEHKQAICADCGQPVKAANGRNADFIASYTAKKFNGTVLCYDCALKRSVAQAEPPEGYHDDVDG